MKLLVATLSIAFVNAAQARSLDSVPRAKTTNVPVVGEYLKEKARGMNDEALVGNLNYREEWYGHMTPQHLINEVMERAAKPENFESIVTSFTNERERNGNNTGYFRDTNLKVLALKSPVPENLDDAGAERLYKAACSGTEVADCSKFTANLFEKNYTNLTVSSLIELVIINSGKLGTANQELPSSLLLKIGQQILTKDPVVEDVFKIVPVYRELARFDGPGNGRNNPGLERPATYQDKGAPQLKVRDQLLQLAFQKSPAATVKFCGDAIVSDFEAVATSIPGKIKNPGLVALIAEQKPLIVMFAKNADETQYAELKNRLETIAQTLAADEAPWKAEWRVRNHKSFLKAIEAARAH